MGLTFNSMLDHLLQGRFDVDPAIVGLEGYARDGRVYSYWGIFFALIRLPLLLLAGWRTIDVTPLSCLVAVCLAAYFKLRTLHFLFAASPASRVRNILFAAMALTILFAGPQIEFLRATVYQEVCLWAGALAAVFVFHAVRGVVLMRFGTSALCTMACAAGLALLARASMGIALYAALGLLMLVLLMRAPVLSRQIIAPAAVLAGFAVLTGLVNYQRWGNPLTFVDFQYYLFNDVYPDRMLRTETYGLFSLARVPFGLVYYFLPFWVFTRTDGRLFLEEHQVRLMDAVELPPSSFLLTDLLLVALLAYALWSLFAAQRSAAIARLHAIAIGTGLATGGLLMLAAITMSFRYRIEFYPLIEFGAFIGLLLLCRRTWSSAWASRIRTWAIMSAAVGIVASHASMLLYNLSELGPVNEELHAGVVEYYAEKIRKQLD